MPEPKQFPTMTLRQVANALVVQAMEVAHLGFADVTPEQVRAGDLSASDARLNEISGAVYDLALEVYALIGIDSDESTREGPPLGGR